MTDHSRINFVAVISAAVLLNAWTVSTQPDPDGIGEQLPRPQCHKFDSYSGPEIVGASRPQGPDAKRTDPPILVPVDPAAPPPPPVPLLEKVTVERASDGDAVGFVISGRGYIGWTARFVQSPRLQKTSTQVMVAGNCILQMDLTGVDAVADHKRGTAQKPPLPDESSVVEVLVFPVDDAVIQTFVGTSSGSPTVSFETVDTPERSTFILRVSG